MKWPFVRRSFHDSLVYKLVEREVRLDTEINRLNQELSKELNSHRETKKLWQESLAHNDLFLNKIKDLEKELHETKDALKIVQEDLENSIICLGEQNKQREIWKRRSNFYMGKCSEAKAEISKARSILKKIAKDL